MKKILSVVAVATLLLVACNKPKATVVVPVMQTSADSMSYVIGLNLGRNLIGIDSLLNVNAVCEGLRDAYLGAEKLNTEEARFFASQGQQRSRAIALKLAEGEICYSEFSDYPVFLFDDVLSELDSKRRDYLINRIKGKQVIMTTCDKNEIREAKKINVTSGKYVAE